MGRLGSPHFYLLLSALGVAIIAVSYGAAPARVLPWLLDVDVEGTNLRHVFRAVMGLYLAMAALWTAGAMRPRLTRAALISEVVFMAGLAFGRIISWLVDGTPSPLFIAYLGLELVFAVWGVTLLRKLVRSPRAAPQ